MLHYHGTPITPREDLYTISGRNYCVSFADPRDLEVCHSIGQSVMLDNGAYSMWKQDTKVDWKEWRKWVEPWLRYHTTWCVLPDVIDGSEEANDLLLEEWVSIDGVPVWHLHESYSRLVRLVEDYDRVCFGSSGSYAIVGNDGWHRRVSETFDMLMHTFGSVPWVHMLRGMSMAGGPYPFSSVDSTDVARNHKRTDHLDIRDIVNRWDSLQCPATWTPQGVQTTLEEIA